MRYRLLEERETIRGTDQYYDHEEARWLHPGLYINTPWGPGLMPFRRPIEEPNTKFCKSCKSCNGESLECATFCQHCGKEFPKPVYRLLREGEKIAVVDELWQDGQWIQDERCTGLTCDPGDQPMRRKISSFTD